MKYEKSMWQAACTADAAADALRRLLAAGKDPQGAEVKAARAIAEATAATYWKADAARVAYEKTLNFITPEGWPSLYPVQETGK